MELWGKIVKILCGVLHLYVDLQGGSDSNADG